jgi:hypothetical protein
LKTYTFLSKLSMNQHPRERIARADRAGGSRERIAQAVVCSAARPGP